MGGRGRGEEGGGESRRERKFSAEVESFALSFERYIETDTDKEIDRKTRERGVGEGVQQSLFTRVIDKYICFFFSFFFYIQPSPKQGTTLDLIIHLHIFSKLRHTGTHTE